MRRLAGACVGASLLFTVAGCASQLEQGIAEFEQGNFDSAASLWTPLAEGGDRLAQNNVAVLWEKGLGSTPQNLPEAAAWYSLSARGGYIPAMVSLARIQRQFAFDEEALSWLELAARWGNQEAITDLQVWGRQVPAADLLQAELHNEEHTRQEQPNTTAIILLPGVAIGVAPLRSVVHGAGSKGLTAAPLEVDG